MLVVEHQAGGDDVGGNVGGIQERISRRPERRHVVDQDDVVLTTEGRLHQGVVLVDGGTHGRADPGPGDVGHLAE